MGELLLIIIVAYASYKFYKYWTEKQHNGNQQANGTGRGNAISRLMNNDNRHIEETGVMIYFANDRHNLPDREYRFKYRYVSGTWRAYIIRTPATPNGRYGIPHTLGTGEMKYICWDRSVTTLKDMQTISRQWADNVQKYIATGTYF